MEEWRSVKGFDDYEVSNKGRIRSIKYRKPFIHKERLNMDGYVKATFRKNGKAYDRRVHRVVALAFIDNPDNLETVNHINGVKTDNRVENLEWMNRTEQLQHAYDLGLKVAPRGIESCNASFTEEEVRYIRKVCKKGSRKLGTSALARQFNVHDTTIGDVVNFKTYKNIK